MTVSQKTLVEIENNFVPECFLYEAVLMFELNYFFMQIDCLRWPPGVFT